MLVLILTVYTDDQLLGAVLRLFDALTFWTDETDQLQVHPTQMEQATICSLHTIGILRRPRPHAFRCAARNFLAGLP